MLKKVLTFTSLATLLNADSYLHLPRGSNNRLNEEAANRDNGNRLFDSQNNNRGGYNVGDMDPVAGFAEDTYMATVDELYNFDFLNTEGDREKQYEELYFESSNISVTWTNQHSAGNQRANSQIILQFICDTFPRPDSAGSDGAIGPSGNIANYVSSSSKVTQMVSMRKHGVRAELMNGGNTNTPDAPESVQTQANGDVSTTYSDNNSNKRGRRESEEYYTLCESRSRNKGLFTADQTLAGDAETYTRQNPNDDRHGLECPEERDYYPWWHPTPFHDIAIITPDVDYCNSNVAPESQNTKAKYHCVRANVSSTATSPDTWLPSSTYVAYNLNETGCIAHGGSWEGFSWGFTGSDHYPLCIDSYWSKDNHLGNVDNTKRGGKMAHYDWQIPTFSDLIGGHMCWNYTKTVSDSADFSGDYSVTTNCVRLMLRLRYNISTMDYDPYQTNATMNEDNADGVISPIEENPTVDVGVFAQGLQLAINTAQTGRTFQDNSHTFLVCQRPSSAAWANSDLLNVNVRGKRGNIVQTFPAIEYDFEPTQIFIEPGDCLHFQWTGSNTHNNGNPAGDGQAGDAGEGRGGSDRSNLVQMLALNQSYPLTYDKFGDFFDYATCYHPLFSSITVSSQDAQLILGTGGFYRSVAEATSLIYSDGSTAVMDNLMDNVSASFRQGLICCIQSTSSINTELESGDIDFSFLSTRNNNFSNRTQKLKIYISKNPESALYW